MSIARNVPAAVAGLLLAWACQAHGAPLPASPDAESVNAGFEAMRSFNLIVLKDLKSSSEVEGRTFVGGDLSGGSSNYNIKPGAQTGPGLIVGGDVTGGQKQVNNGGDLKVGGDLDSGANMNGGGDVYVGGDAKKVNANGASVYAGGDVQQTNAQDIHYGGSIKTSNGALHADDHSQDGLEAEIAATTAALTEALLDTSSYLAGLDPTNALTYSADHQQAIFDAGTGTGAAVFSISDLKGSLTGRSQLIFNTPSTYDFVVVNVAGTTVSLPSSINFNGPSGLGAKVIWNFYEATSVNLGAKSWYGSVLAPKAELRINNFIEGSVVARSLVQNGEIHMANFQAKPVVVGMGGGAVPEPATWAMMILGFGAIGAVIRRRRALAA